MGPSAAKRLQAAALTRWGPHHNFENVYSTRTFVYIKSELLAQLLTVRSNRPSRALPPVGPTLHSVYIHGWGGGPSNENTSLTTSVTRWGSNRGSTPVCGREPNTSSEDHPGRTGVSGRCILYKYADVEDIPGVRVILDVKRGSRISDPDSSVSLALINLITVDNPNLSPSSSDSESWR